VISGFEIGHDTADGDGWLTGTTVISAPHGAVGGVDVRGGGPGTQETDLLSPQAMVEQVDAVVLTGGSAYGLAAVDGVVAGLEAAGRGFAVGPDPAQVVPIVPAAVLFDLGRGGHFEHRPTADFGSRALAAASADDPATGCVGAGTGATCGGLKGGFGYAELSVGPGSVAAAVVVNAVGSAVDPATGRLWADRLAAFGPPTDAERRALNGAYAQAMPPPLNTTIGVVLTDLAITKAQAGKVAAVAHDGLARAIRPAHSMLDGDTVFCLASARVEAPPDPMAARILVDELLSAAADVFADACFVALLAAGGRGVWPAYTDLAPSLRR
jgi:L-aminopeptidase/D-esterase-like protein